MPSSELRTTRDWMWPVMPSPAIVKSVSLSTSTVPASCGSAATVVPGSATAVSLTSVTACAAWKDSASAALNSSFFMDSPQCSMVMTATARWSLWRESALCRRRGGLPIMRARERDLRSRGPDPALLRSGVAALPPGLEHRHGDRIAQVQAALPGAQRQSHALVRSERLANRLRQPRGFGAEHEPVAGLPGHVGKAPSRMRISLVLILRAARERAATPSTARSSTRR